MIRIGFFARADNGGLGTESMEFCRWFQPAKVLVIRGEHGHHPERFAGLNCQYVDGLPTSADLDLFLRDLDVLFSIESYYNWGAIEMARQRGIKTILRVNYEMNVAQLVPDFPHPDLYLVPSMWNWDKITEPKKYIPFPVNRQLCKFKLRNKIERFYHVAGHNLWEDRNGTEILLDALQYTNAPITILTQHDLGRAIQFPNVIVNHQDRLNYFDVHQGDCLILPRRYGGQSLQLNEALSMGIPIIMPDISPQNAFLEPKMLIPTIGSRKIKVQGGEVDCYDINPRVLAEKINELYNEDITNLSQKADELAANISWETLKPRYEEVFKEVYEGRREVNRRM